MREEMHGYRIRCSKQGQVSPIDVFLKARNYQEAEKKFRAEFDPRFYTAEFIVRSATEILKTKK